MDNALLHRKMLTETEMQNHFSNTSSMQILKQITLSSSLRRRTKQETLFSFWHLLWQDYLKESAVEVYTEQAESSTILLFHV